MSAPAPDQDNECGARHPHFPAITSKCTQPVGHDGPHVSIEDYIQWEA